MWQAHLNKELNITSLYFNAWESDFSTDPMVAFVAEISSHMEETQKENDSYKPHLSKARKIATAFAKRAIPAAVRIGTAGVLNLDDYTEEALSSVAEEGIKDAIDLYTTEKSLMEKFHEALNSTIKTLEDTGHSSTLIIFIDELDRCRPTYAIELLERVKHLFNIENVIFVISIDKEQLGISLQAVYGNGFDSNEYLRRFIDTEFNLPKADSKLFTDHLVSKFSFKEYFKQRIGDFSHDFTDFIDTFNALSTVFDLSLRAREQCFTRVAIALSSTPSNRYLFPELLTTLTILNVTNKATYKSFVFGDGLVSEVINVIKLKSGGKEFLTSRDGLFVEAYLLVVKSDRHADSNPELEAYKIEAHDSNKDSPNHSHAKDLIDVIKYINQKHHYGVSLANITDKLELAAQFVN
jgi:hypothetical protein